MTGWPWPLEAVQGFFEGMWSGIVNAISAGGQWLWGQITSGLNWLWSNIQSGLQWVWERLSEFGSWLWGQISGGLQWVWDRLQEIGSAIINAIAGGLPVIGQAIQDFINAILSPIQSGLSWLYERISEALAPIQGWIQSGIEWIGSRLSEGLQSILAPIQSGLSWLWDSIQAGISGLGSQVGGWLSEIGSAISTGVAQLGGQISQSADYIANQIQAGMGWLYSEIVKYADGVMTSIAQALQLLPQTSLDLVKQFITELQTQWSQLVSGLTSGVLGGQVAGWQPITSGMAAPAGSISPELSASTAKSHEAAGHAIWAGLFAATVAAELATLGQVDVNLGAVWTNPYIAAMMDTTKRIISIPTEIGIIRPYQYLLNAQYTPNLPSPEDMIRFMVKEAWYPDKQVEMPEQFIGWMKWLGYSEQWTRLYWGAHWRLPEIGQVFTMLHRKLITPEFVDNYLKLADIEPSWRPLLRAISYELPDRIRTRWMYEWGLIDLQTWRMLDEMSGLSPEWSERMVMAELKNILRDDIGAIRAQLHKAVVEGLMSEAEYRQYLQNLGLPQPVIDARVTAAVIARDTEAKLEMLKALRSAYVEGKIERQDYLESLARLGVEADAISVLAQADDMKKLPKPIKPKDISAQLAEAQDKVRIAELTLQFAREDYEALQSQMAADLAAIDADLAKKLADIDDRLRLLQARWQFAKTTKEAALIQVEVENLLAERAQVIDLHNARYAEAQTTWQARLLNAQQKVRDAELKLAIAQDRLSRLAGSAPSPRAG
jgi:hypothetical protein